MNKWSFVTLAVLAGAGCAAVACSSDGDDASATTGGSAGKSSGGSGGSSTAGKGGGTAAAGASEGGASSIYDDLGQAPGITKAVDAIVAAEVMDDDIASYFSQQQDANHSPTVADIKDCLVTQLEEATGGPQVYAGHKTSSGWTCRSMAATHANLNINSGTFDKFVTIAAGVLAADPFNVPAKDLGPIGTTLNGLEPDIVTAKPDSDTERPCTAPAACAAEAGAGGSN